MPFVCPPKILLKHCLYISFSLQLKWPQEKLNDNAYSNFWGDKQRALWYVMVFSRVVNTPLSNCGRHKEPADYSWSAVLF